MCLGVNRLMFGSGPGFLVRQILNKLYPYLHNKGKNKEVVSNQWGSFLSLKHTIPQL